MLLDYPKFYKKHGIDRISRLRDPFLTPVAYFEFPLDSFFHQIPKEPTEIFPDLKVHYLSPTYRKVIVDHIAELKSVLGKPIKHNVNIHKDIMDYHRGLKNVKLANGINLLEDDKKILNLTNYGLIEKVYTYNANPLKAYYDFKNIVITAIDKIKEIADNSNKQNFIKIDLSDQLPSLTTINNFGTNITTKFISIFNTMDKYLLYEFFTWLGSNREISVFNNLTMEEAQKTNIIISYKDKLTVVNLDFINSIRRNTNSINKSKSDFDSHSLQKIFLRLFLYIQSPEIIENKDLVLVDGIKNNVIISDNENQTEDEIFELKDIILNDDILDVAEDQEVIKNEVESDTELLTIDPEIEFNSLDENIIIEEVLKFRDIKENLIAKLDKQVNDGVMSVVDYRNNLKAINGIDKISSPYNSDLTLKENSTVNLDEVNFDLDQIKLPNVEGVVDQSMLETRLQQFDTKYIKNILPKEILGMVNQIQNAGFIIQDYTIDDITNILGSSELHSIKIKPLNGVSSLLNFRIPKVNPDTGDFTAGGNKYKLGKQRSDLPIRKIDNNEVALSSYYGKVFVYRSAFKNDDIAYWLSKNIIKIGLNDEDTSITKVIPATLFDSKFKSPRIYSGLSQYLKEFSTSEYTLFFNHNDRIKYLKEDELNKYEGKDKILCGISKNGNLIFIDYNNQFYIKQVDNFIPIGDIFTITGLNKSKAPLESVTLRVFKKQIHLCLIFGYYIGISKLIKLLKTTPIFKEAKDRTIIPNYWCLTFKDKKVWISEKDQVATLVLSGFLKFEKILKKYDYNIFNKQDIYFKILDESGITTRYIKEIETLEDLFIDPITKNILLDMKEPTTWKGLLLRSCELLLTDEYPDEQDTKYMRFKGYERIAGHIYKELTNAVRDYKVRGVYNRGKISINPKAVWLNILVNDPSKAQVSDINPLDSLKQQELATYGGFGGRSKGAFGKDSRSYHENDIGIISEATKDSKDVSFNAYFSANPSLNNLYGMSGDYNFEEGGNASFLSTSMLLAPAAVHDDFFKSI